MESFDDLVAKCKDVQLHARGGQKSVYRALHPTFGDVMIKLYFTFDNPRAMREIEIAQSIGLNCVPKIYDTGVLLHEKQETLYIVEQRILGEELGDRIGRKALFSLVEAVAFLEQGLKFIKQIEARGIVHRDLKPDNIIIMEDGTAYFLDFGIARVLGLPSLTATEDIVGPHTPGYAAPEQFNNLKDKIDSRADLYSLGVVVYECLTGFNPNLAGIPNRQVAQNKEKMSPFARPKIPGDTEGQLIRFLHSLMHHHISRRPKNAEQALQWLEAAKPTFEY